MQSVPPPPTDLSEPLLGVLTRYVSVPTAQSIVKLARQRANVTSARIDRTRLGDMLAPIERNLRLFLDDPVRVLECCATLQALAAGSSAPAPTSTPSPPSSPGSVRFSQGSSSAPSSVRFPQVSPSQSSAPASVRFPVASRSTPLPPPSSALAPPSALVPPSVRAPSSSRSSFPALMVHLRVEDDIARARIEARELATKLGFSVVGRTRLVTAVSELARNIVLYANEGQIELTPVAVPPGLAVVARDRGPGIPNIEQIMSGNYKSQLGMGLGLRGVKQIADRFDIQTAAGQGTTVSFSLKVM